MRLTLTTARGGGEGIEEDHFLRERFANCRCASPIAAQIRHPRISGPKRNEVPFLAARNGDGPRGGHLGGADGVV